MARVELPASRVRARRRKRRLITIGIICAALMLTVGSLAWFSHAPFLRITHVEVSGQQTISSSTVSDVVQKTISGSYWYLFAKDDIFLYPKTFLEATLPKEIPVLASVHVRALNFNAIEVDIIERQPKALWCAGTVESSSTNCLLLDQGGAAYAPAGFSIAGESGTYKHFYGELSNTTTTPQQYLATGSFTSLGALVDTIAQNQPQDSIVGVYVDQNDDVRVSFASGFMLLFALSADGGDVYQRFELALQSDAFVGHSIADFEYLDLRFGDRLYYKLKTQ